PPSSATTGLSASPYAVNGSMSAALRSAPSASRRAVRCAPREPLGYQTSRGVIQTIGSVLPQYDGASVDSRRAPSVQSCARGASSAAGALVVPAGGAVDTTT